MATLDEITVGAGQLRRKLEAVGEHQRSVRLAEGLGLSLAVIIPALGLAMVLDNMVHLSMGARIVMLAGLVTGSVFLIRRALSALRERMSPEQIARKIESTQPDIDNRLINSLLLAREDDAESAEIIRTVVAEGVADASHLGMDSVVPKRKLKALFSAAGVGVLLMGGYFLGYPQYFANALTRVVLPVVQIPPLTRTRIVKVTPENRNILAGDSITISVKVAGKVPEAAETVTRQENDDTQVAVMQPIEPRDEFQCTLSDVNRTLSYKVAAGDTESENYRIIVHHRPVVSELAVRITPPAYVELPPTDQKGGTIKALAGSTVAIRGACSKPIAKAWIELAARGRHPIGIESPATVAGSFAVAGDEIYRIGLTDTLGFDSAPVDHHIEVVVDEPPEIRMVAPELQISVGPTDSIPFEFTALDRYGVRSAEIVQVGKDPAGKATEVTLQHWTTPSKTQKNLQASTKIPASALKLQPGKSGVLQVVAKDWNDVTGPGVGRSQQILVTLMLPEQARQQDKENLKASALGLAQVIQKQRQNIAIGLGLREQEARKQGSIAASAAKLDTSIKLQEEVRTDSAALLDRMEDKLPIKPTLRLLYENEMVSAVNSLRAVRGAAKPGDALKEALDTENTILSRLTGRNEQMRMAPELAAMKDVFSLLEELLIGQKQVRRETDAVAKAKGSQAGPALADKQDALGAKVVKFKEMLDENAKSAEKADADMAARFKQASGMLAERRVRPNMLLAADHISKNKAADAVGVQDKIIEDLTAIGKFLREPIATAAAKKLEELKDLVKDNKEKAEKLAKLEAAVKEISQELERSKDMAKDETMRQKEEEVKDLKEKIDDVIEKMAKDLSLFPEIPACNELVAQMREVYEDIKQKEGSENAPVEEVAVDRGETKGVKGEMFPAEQFKERMADMEMWLMDAPDTTAWKQEGFDNEELGDIPLANLPEELEDLVGDLVDQQQQLQKDANDSASNMMAPDVPAGWDTGDGPLPDFGAKGKSGNAKPQDMEQTGRAGGGRQGKSDGEMVENFAKDLEGADVEARRTKDPFQKGKVDEENPNSEAKATGGGKESGVGGEGGLRGAAPARNELGMRDMERRQAQMKRETESLYAKASLLYLPSGELDKAILLMNKADKQIHESDFDGFSETQRRIAHALRNTKREIAGEEPLKLDPLYKLPANVRKEMFNARDESIPPEFEKMVSEYYKAIAAGTVK